MIPLKVRVKSRSPKGPFLTFYRGGYKKLCNHQQGSSYEEGRRRVMMTNSFAVDVGAEGGVGETDGDADLVVRVDKRI